MKTRTMLVFPTLVAAFGGAEYVSYTDRFAWVKLPGQKDVVRVRRSLLPREPGMWTAFRLAVIAKAVA